MTMHRRVRKSGRHRRSAEVNVSAVIRWTASAARIAGFSLHLAGDGASAEIAEAAATALGILATWLPGKK